ncbi:hypothetical protein F5144DRAFT_613931 [Chaetomium tenue]|uniref:Uncharacterized protein n=1 Tax=Chaetomium tenue TaxID=1854479 RepID=A0ACB7P4V0_9PEZI|nr:hypothetical protein F5144DRAFT_613931 [Chaetomium globosum]
MPQHDAAAAATAKDRHARLTLCRHPRSNHTVTKCSCPPHHQKLPPSSTTAASDPNPVADDNEPDQWVDIVRAYIAMLEEGGKTLAMIRSIELWRLYNRFDKRGAALEPARSIHRLILKLVEERLIFERRLSSGLDDDNSFGFAGDSLMTND